MDQTGHRVIQKTLSLRGSAPPRDTTNQCTFWLAQSTQRAQSHTLSRTAHTEGTESHTVSHSAHGGHRVTQKTPSLRGSAPPRDTPTHPNVIACQPRRFHATVALATGME